MVIRISIALSRGFSPHHGEAPRVRFLNQAVITLCLDFLVRQHASPVNGMIRPQMENS